MLSTRYQSFNRKNKKTKKKKKTIAVDEKKKDPKYFVMARELYSRDHLMPSLNGRSQVTLGYISDNEENARMEYTIFSFFLYFS